MSHYQNVPAVGLGRKRPHGLWWEVRQDGRRRLAGAQVGAAALVAGQLRGTAVMLVDTARGGAPQLVVALKVLGQLGQVRGCGRRASESAQFIMRWLLEHLLEHGGVKVLPPQDVLLPWLLDLNDHRYDKKDQYDAARHADDGAVGVIEVVQDVGFPLFYKTQQEA